MAGPTRVCFLEETSGGTGMEAMVVTRTSTLGTLIIGVLLPNYGGKMIHCHDIENLANTAVVDERR